MSRALKMLGKVLLWLVALIVGLIALLKFADMSSLERMIVCLAGGVAYVVYTLCKAVDRLSGLVNEMRVEISSLRGR